MVFPRNLRTRWWDVQRMLRWCFDEYAAGRHGYVAGRHVNTAGRHGGLMPPVPRRNYSL